MLSLSQHLLEIVKLQVVYFFVRRNMQITSQFYSLKDSWIEILRTAEEQAAKVVSGKQTFCWLQDSF
jgi:hypothetical protein